MNRYIQLASKNHNNLMLVGSVVGANWGTFMAHNETDGDFLSYAGYALFGGAFGMMAGAVSPFLLPAIAIGAPGYLAAKAAKAYPPSVSLPFLHKWTDPSSQQQKDRIL